MFNGLVDLLFGCRHKKTTRPITPSHKVGSVPGETYVACLACGKKLHYDLATMRIGKPIAPPKKSSAVDSFQTPDN
jgi:hypothetical protein